MPEKASHTSSSLVARTLIVKLNLWTHCKIPILFNKINFYGWRSGGF